VPVEQHGAPGADADRLERRRPADDGLVVGVKDRLGRIDEAAAGDRDGEERARFDQRRRPSVNR
jgi:hypothetical protein